MTRMQFTIAASLILTLFLLGSALADPLDTKSFYDRDGSFAGSSSAQHGSGVSGSNSTSFYDRDGRFSGSSIRNSNGTTSLYDRNGHFTGSVVNTSPPR
jgi:hypothetical protein